MHKILFIVFIFTLSAIVQLDAAMIKDSEIVDKPDFFYDIINLVKINKQIDNLLEKRKLAISFYKDKIGNLATFLEELIDKKIEKQKNLTESYKINLLRKKYISCITLRSFIVGAAVGFKMGYSYITPAALKTINQWSFYKKLSDSNKKRLTKFVVPIFCTGLSMVTGGILTFYTTAYSIKKIENRYILKENIKIDWESHSSEGDSNSSEDQPGL